MKRLTVCRNANCWVNGYLLHYLCTLIGLCVTHITDKAVLKEALYSVELEYKLYIIIAYH